MFKYYYGVKSIAENHPTLNLSKNSIIAGIVLAILFPWLLSVFMLYLPLKPPVKVYASRFIFWSDVLLLWVYALKVEKQRLLIRTEKNSGIEFILASVGILYLLALGAQIIASIPALFGYHENNAVMRQIAATVRGKPGLIIFISITAGVCEEVIFRGYVLTRLSLFFKNRYIPVVLSALLFSALHYKYNMPREYIFTFLIGMVFGLYYQNYGNIKPLIIAHFLIDVIGLTLSSHFLK